MSEDTPNPVGRPTKYTPELVAKAKYYLNNYKEYEDVIPQIAGLAITLDISRDTVYDWAKDEDKREFSDIVKLVLVAQERKLMNGGLDGTFNSNITKLALTKHGYHDKQDNKVEASMTVNIGDKDAGSL